VSITAIKHSRIVFPNPSQEVIGIMHNKIGDFSIHDIDFVIGFDVGDNKIGKSINEAIYELPNMVHWIPKDKMPKTSANNNKKGNIKSNNP